MVLIGHSYIFPLNQISDIFSMNVGEGGYGV
jgi:hypothetical protein